MHLVFVIVALTVLQTVCIYDDSQSITAGNNECGSYCTGSGAYASNALNGYEAAQGLTTATHGVHVDGRGINNDRIGGLSRGSGSEHEARSGEPVFNTYWHSLLSSFSFTADSSCRNLASEEKYGAWDLLDSTSQNYIVCCIAKDYCYNGELRRRDTPISLSTCQLLLDRPEGNCDQRELDAVNRDILERGLHRINIPSASNDESRRFYVLHQYYYDCIVVHHDQYPNSNQLDLWRLRGLNVSHYAMIAGSDSMWVFCHRHSLGDYARWNNVTLQSVDLLHFVSMWSEA